MSQLPERYLAGESIQEGINIHGVTKLRECLVAIKKNFEGLKSKLKRVIGRNPNI